MDLTEITESFRRGFQEIPPVLIGLTLLGGPTIALIVYRLFGVARRMQASGSGRATPFWVCHDCRSMNEMRLARCYRCGFERASTEEVEIFIDRPGFKPVPLGMPSEGASAASSAPAASAAQSAAPSGASAAPAAKGRKRSGTPVMAEAGADVNPVAVGPGREPTAVPAEAGAQDEAGAGVETDK